MTRMSGESKMGRCSKTLCIGVLYILLPFDTNSVAFIYEKFFGNRFKLIWG